MPGVNVFLDSNVFLYSVDEDDHAKRVSAHGWLESLSTAQSGITNLQVLNEVTNVLLKRRRKVAPTAIFRIVDGFAEFGARPLRAELTDPARHLHTRFGYSWWDCLLLASALDLGCSHFLSEDMQDGRRIEGKGGEALTIVNPFAHTPAEILASIRD